jgi:anti-sigma regulatory factor (Ser/Thr protein kinase)
VNHDNCLPRKAWEIFFSAEPREVAALRRIIRSHLMRWGLLTVVEAAELCVSELVTNVIKHVGVGTPATLTVSMSGTNLRLEVRDPSMGVLSANLPASPEAEEGRGLALVEAMAESWGVCLTAGGKATWCELATALTSPHGHVRDHRVARADVLLTSYGEHVACFADDGEPSLGQSVESAVGLIADLLHWIQAHGLDPEAELDRAHSRFEAMSGG